MALHLDSLVRSRGLVPVRDSKVPSGPVLSFPPALSRLP
ncbi:DUF397 domain-containing protein [Streptomyces sp. NPDC049099]